jgi:predicted oxidoreductase
MLPTQINEMKKTSIHGKGPEFSRIVAGAWRWNHVSPGELDALIKQAIDLGITTFDHADIYGDYGNELIFGDAIRRQPSLAKEMQTVTKCGIKLLSAARPEHRVKHYDTSKAHIIASVDNSLRLLAVEKIDLLLIHRPDPLMQVKEVAEAFTSLKKEGKVLHFGVSNFSTSQFDLLQSALSFPLVTNQLEISLFHPNYMFDGTIDHLYQLGVSPMAWSPLGGGKPLQAGHEGGNLLNEKALPMMEKYGIDFPQLLLAWLLHHPANIFPVVGTSKPARLRDAAKVLDIRLDRQDWFQLLQWARGHEVP